MPLNMFSAPVEEVVHGVVVRDPYRWLENRDLPETMKWILDQQKQCEAYFAECGNLGVLRNRVRGYLDVEVVDQPAKVAGKYFYRRRDRGQEQAGIFIQDAAASQERLLVAPGRREIFASAGIYRISEDGLLLAYELKQGGGDKKAIYIFDVENGNTLPDRLETGYARGFAFTSDKKGFYYCNETSGSSEDHIIRLHYFGDTEADQTIFQVMRSRGSRLTFTADDVHLGALWLHQYKSKLVVDFFIAHRNKPSTWKRVFANRTAPYGPILKHGRIFALTYDETPNGMLVELNAYGREISSIVPELDARIRQLVIARERVYVSYLHHLIPSIQCWTLSGKSLGEIDIPADGTIQLLPNLDMTESSFFYTYESFVQPRTIFEYFPKLGKSQLWYRRVLPLPATHCHVRHISFSSKDGTQIPMILAARQKSSPETAVPMIMTGYGGFGVPMTPQFSVLVSILMELGFAFALPYIRGGGEFGKAWHDSARGRNRQVAFDDFIAAAEWLCVEGKTISEKLAIFGGSNSGLLVAAAMTQRQDLFRAALCIAPLLDMVRYERFDQAAKWWQEYGTIEDPEDFHALHAYSPYHHVEDAIDYPAVLFVTGDQDDRCNPAHVRKMAARLQQREAQTRPVLVDYSIKRGHSPVLPLSVRTEALVRRIAFLCRELKVSTAGMGDSDEMPCA